MNPFFIEIFNAEIGTQYSPGAFSSLRVYQSIFLSADSMAAAGWRERIWRDEELKRVAEELPNPD